ncbi:MAG: ASKHA domain-containing protein [Anaerolineae bacterium]
MLACLWLLGAGLVPAPARADVALNGIGPKSPRRRSVIERCKVTLLPAHRTVEVDKGTLLHDAMALAGLPASLPCGGQGRCGRCLVQVQAGQVLRRSVSRITPEQVDAGYALACQTLVEGDVTLLVPEQAAEVRPETASAAEKVATTVAACEHARNPWVRKYHLSIDPPDLEDNTTDYERLKRELARQHGIRDLTTSLPVLRRLAGALRDAHWDVTAIVEQGAWNAPEAAPRLVDVRAGDTTARTLGVALDIGTTSVVVYLVDLPTGDVLDLASAYNAQIACGEDVISRILYARRQGGLERLQALVVETINTLIDQVLARQGAVAEDVYWMTVAGNTTMMHLFLGLDPQHIRLEPYIPTVTHPMPVRASELGLHMHSEATVDCLPGVGAYVGADITAGVLRAEMGEQEPLTLFIDVGTNGEIVLGNADWLIACACSAGPAFEGAGVASGMRAVPGAIDEVRVDRATAEPTYRVIGGQPPRGICGSGMISLLGEMFVTGVVDKSGRLNQHLATPRIRVAADGPEYVVAPASETVEGQRDIVLTETDIQNLLRAKGAIYAGFTVLAESVGVSLSDVERILIGGGFGKYIDIEKAIEIGLLPDLPWDRFSYLGNTSVQGAYLALVCRDHRAQVAKIAGKMTYLELSADNSFMNAFTSALFLPHTDLDAFPTVRQVLAEQNGA